MNANVKVNNVSESAKEFNYWVVRADNGKIWFYGAYNDCDKANDVALDVDGFVVENKGAEE